MHAISIELPSRRIPCHARACFAAPARQRVLSADARHRLAAEAAEAAAAQLAERQAAMRALLAAEDAAIAAELRQRGLSDVSRMS